MRRRAALVGMAGGVFGAASVLRAQPAWPARPLRLVVPFPPGGSNDLVARLIQPRLQQALGQPVLLEHRGGLSGGVGAATVARAAPDGHTWLLANENLATAEALGALPAPIAEAFAACTVVGASPLTLTAHPRTGFSALADMVAAARAQPGVLGYATNGSGSGGHVAGVALQRIGGFSLDHVPYRGGATALADGLEGLVPLLLLNAAVTLAPIRDGRLRPLAVSQAAESRFLPGVPTLASLGFPALDLQTYWAVLGPAGVPPAILATLHAAIAGALDDAATRARLAEYAITPLAAGPEAAGSFLAADVARWGGLVRSHGITAAS
jgi:tripartite-type tricarboxylate transporter receptor subunit TctC